MQITEINIENFRSVRRANVKPARLSTLIGPNNCGKSNILRALEYALNPRANITVADFPAGELPVGRISVTVTFSALTPTERDIFSTHVRSDGSLIIRRFGSVVNDHPVNNGYESLTENNTTQNISPEFLRPGMLPEFYFVPALFDIQRELAVTDTSHFGRLLKLSLRGAPFMQEMTNILQMSLPGLASSSSIFNMGGLATLASNLNKDLQFFNGSVLIEPPKLSAEQIFELGTVLSINDGAATAPDRKGHGLQRALILAMIRRWAELRTRQPKRDLFGAQPVSDSAIFAIEEPELNIHPHGLRKLIDDLRSLSGLLNHQVFVCSHSPHFIDLEIPESLIIVEKKSAVLGTTTKQFSGDLFPGDSRRAAVQRFNAAAFFNPDRNELFFAERIVLVEGATEKKLIPFLGHLLGVFGPGISVIDCDGKYNLRLFMEVLNGFQKNYMVIHDRDPVGESPSPQMRAVFNENEKISAVAVKRMGNEVFVCDPDLEGWLGIKTELNKPFSAYDQFKDRKPEAIDERLRNLITKIYSPPIPKPVQQ